MKIRVVNKKEKTIKAVPEILDDLWHLEQIVEVGDLVSGISDRKIKGKDEHQKSLRVTLFVTIAVETVLFYEYASLLKVNGTVTAAKPEELAPLKSHQSIDFELGKEIKIQKKEWKEYQIQRLKKAQDATGHKATLLVALDDETATLGWLKAFDLKPVGSVRAHKTGKRMDDKTDYKHAYFSEIMRILSKLKPERIVFAGPGFAKDNLKKWLAEQHKKIAPQLFFESINSTGVTGLHELIKSNALSKIVQQAQFVKDAKLVEKFLAELGKQTGLAEYGLKAVQNAVQQGAVQELIVADTLLRTQQQKIAPLLQSAESMKASVHIVNGKTDSGEKIMGFGGIVALRRYAAP